MIIDLWANAMSSRAAKAFVGQEGFGGIEGFFGTDVQAGMTDAGLVAEMDRVGVDRAMLSTALSAVDEGRVAFVAEHRDRLLLAASADDVEHPRRQSADVRARAADSILDAVRVSPLVQQYPLNHALYYPLYATCEELGLPVSINIGIPGPRVRSRCQDPVLLEDVLIDFPDLVVIGAHMGHPYEDLLIEYLLKWPNLYLSNSAYLAKYMHSGLVKFMGSSRGRGRVLFASDHPFLPMDKALDAARQLPLGPEAMSDFLGDAAARILGGRAGD
ncbi:MAG TPA: amidohydrolase family protein [Acidimicrobiales bacterium]|nr:amidohydrolase family protein [Acidimicrobiales bacterium]